MAEVLDTGPPPRPARTRRWVTIAGGVALAAVATLLAARSDPDPAAAPAPTPTTAAPTRPAGEPGEAVLVSVAVGRRAVYALASRCDTSVSPVCRFQLYRRDLGNGRWRPLPWQIGPRRGIGLAPALSVTGDEVVTIVTTIGRAQVYTSSDDGITVAERPLVPGPPVAAATTGSLLGQDYCSGCEDRVTVLEPTTGRARPLAVQPPFRGSRLRSVDRAGDVLWAVAVDRQRTTTAVSTDAGRSWRLVPVPGRSSPNQLLLVVAGRDGSAWLVAGSYLGGPPQQLTQVRRITGPGGAWRTLPEQVPRTMRSVLAGERGLLLAEANGILWRLSSDGRFRRLPEPGLFRPGELVTGPGGEVVALSPDDANGRTVLLSYDEGETWRAEQVF